MSFRPRDLYDQAPVPLQHLVTTGYGARELRRRYTGGFRESLYGLERRQWWSPDRLRADQDERLRAMVRHCADRVPHYRDLFRRCGIAPGDIRTVEDLAALPTLDKETVRADPDRFVPEPRPRGLIHQTTGGTTGTPLRSVATRRAVQFNYATYEARARRWAGVRFGDRLATFQGQPIVPAGRFDGPLWRRNLAFNQLYLSVYHLSDETLPRYVEALARFAPRVVAGYTSAVHRVAQHLLDRGDLERVTPVAVMVSSETLTSRARGDIEAAFGCRAFDGYSLGELVAFVSECPCGELHVSTDYGVVELVDSDVGSEIVATGLLNPATPLLRYRTGDVAEWGPSTPSRCGRGLPVLAGLSGRVDDVVRTPEGTAVGPAPMSLAFQHVPHLRRVQVHQDVVERARFLLEVAEDYSDQDQHLLERELRARLGPGLAMAFERVDSLPRTTGGKERLVVSTVADG